MRVAGDEFQAGFLDFRALLRAGFRREGFKERLQVILAKLDVQAAILRPLQG